MWRTAEISLATEHAIRNTVGRSPPLWYLQRAQRVLSRVRQFSKCSATPPELAYSVPASEFARGHFFISDPDDFEKHGHKIKLGIHSMCLTHLQCAVPYGVCRLGPARHRRARRPARPRPVLHRGRHEAAPLRPVDEPPDPAGGYRGVRGAARRDLPHGRHPHPPRRLHAEVVDRHPCGARGAQCEARDFVRPLPVDL